MCFSTSCSVGQTSAKIVLSATEQFEEEYEAHIRKKSMSCRGMHRFRKYLY